MINFSSTFYVRLRHLLKTSVGYTAYLSGLVDHLAAYRTGISNQRRVIILGYHRIVEDFQASSQHAIPSLLISNETFRRQLELVLKKFDCISLDEALAAFSGARPLQRDAVVITFDDGYRDFYDLAYPILRAYGVPGAIYMTSGFVGARAPFMHDQLYFLVKEAARQRLSLPLLLVRHGFHEVLPRARRAWSQNDHFSVMRALFELPHTHTQAIVDALRTELNISAADFPADYDMLDWPMLREMADAGITIGAHTRTHALLTKETPAAAEREIRESKAELEQGLGRRVDHFAYPDGRYDDAIVAMVRAAGFRSACTIEDRPNTLRDDILRLKRKVVWEHTCLGLFGDYSDVIAECQLRGLFANPAYKWQASLQAE